MNARLFWKSLAVQAVVVLVPFGLLDLALSKAGVVHETYLLPANDHGFDVNWGGFGTQIARAKIEQFLQK